MSVVQKKDASAVTPLHWIERKRIEEARLKPVVREQLPPVEGLIMFTVTIIRITSAQ